MDSAVAPQTATGARRRRPTTAQRIHFASATVVFGPGAAADSAAALAPAALALTAALPPLGAAAPASAPPRAAAAAAAAPTAVAAAPASPKVAPAGPGAKPATRPASDVLAGALARAASQSIIHPLDTLKVRLQANMRAAPVAPPPGAGAGAAAGSSVVKVPLAVCIRSVQAGVYANVFVAARSITSAAGPRGLFTGYWPTLLEDVPDMACKFAAYESMRQLHRRLVNGRDASPGEDFAMGALAGAAAAAATTPLDVVKTRMMCTAASRPTMAGAAAAVLAAGGPGAFFAGVGARALSNGINSAVFFCAFESIRGALRRRAPQAAPADGGGSCKVEEVEQGQEGWAAGRRRAELEVAPLAVGEVAAIAADPGHGGRGRG